MTVLSRLLAVALFASSSMCVVAQTSAPPNAVDAFKDTSMVKPPDGAKVAIYEFEDLECPYCALAFPVVHAAVDHYRIPLVRHDFPLVQHPWSFDAAVNARYIQDKISPKMAEDYRRDVFVNQNRIASKDDLSSFTQRWFQSRGQSMPFVMDASGNCTKEVRSDQALGQRMGLMHTPCIFVVTQKRWVQVVDINQLYRTIDVALAETGGPAAVTGKR
jgi:protein-disulfide isomerase